ncbi:histone-fold-containing protein [Flagelloscypha sp. PMI_526]|nr:histone-fold-containing protein [Flagelloscypha sp. PMI_526]
MSSPTPTDGPYVQSGQTLNDFLQSFWQRQINTAETEVIDHRHPPLPLARIKKVMKSDPEIKMIAADAPILLCKACEILISEITSRAYIIADSNKRRTISRSDVAKGLTKSDQFDFLIDIVPREEEDGAVGSGGRRVNEVPQPLPPNSDVYAELDTLLNTNSVHPTTVRLESASASEKEDN